VSGTNQPNLQTPLAAPAKIAWAILISATLFVCYFSHLGALGFIGPDEPRYAWIARAMVETGDWVTPRLYGQPWFEKPPLFYWGAALSFKLFGVSEAAARLPSAICALLATLALAWLAWRLYGAETARWLLLLLPTTVGMIGFSHAAATDMPFSAMLTIAMVCVAVALRLLPPRPAATATLAESPADGRNRRDSRASNAPADPIAVSSHKTPRLALLFFGFFLGLAVLAKGPAAIILCGGAVFFWALFTRRWRDAFRLLHPAAIAAFCVTALPWYILCAQRNPDFLRIFIVEHNFKRYLTPEFQHIQPFWFYLPVLLVALLPWVVLLLWTATTAFLDILRKKPVSPSGAYLLSWALFCFLFFSISQSKLPGYILPSIPAFALLMAKAFSSLVSPLRLRFQLAQLFAALLFLVLCVMLETSAHHSRHGTLQFAGPLGIVLGLIGAANLIVALFPPRTSRHEFGPLLSALTVVPILAALLLTNRLLPSFFFWDPSGRTIARQIEQRGVPTDHLFVQGMRRGQMYSLSFYLRKEVQTWNQDRPVEGYLLTGSRLCKDLAPPTWSCQKQPFDVESTGESLFRVSPAAQ
jgi:4-amino-4-deoxy-L-arabinose transferase-like glycosyltransferase